MVKLLIGQAGIGKTKDIINNANSSVTTTKGNVVFIGESNESILELNHDIRYINISEFPINSSNEVIAFLHGLMGSNYDITKMYLDGILNVFIMSVEEICDWLVKIEAISTKLSVDFEISISYHGDIPECLSKYL